MDFFSLLEKKQADTGFDSSSEMRFFLENSGLLADFPMFARYGKAQKSFDIFRANIVIRSIINKQLLDEAYEEALRLAKKESSSDTPELTAEGLSLIARIKERLPYFQEGDNRIYIPILPRSVNKIYSDDISKLGVRPFKNLLSTIGDAMAIDPFDMYGDDLFQSYFTKLIRIRKDESVSAYWDYDSCSVYIINKQGRLDCRIALFDKALKKKSLNHILERLSPAMDAFFSYDKVAFQKALVDNQLISSRLVYRNRFDEKRLFEKIDAQFDLK